VSSFGPSELLDCYRAGIFPMADGRDNPSVYLVDPEMRGILPLDGLHISRSLAKFMRIMPFRVSYDTAFRQVIASCAEAAPDREDTWINDGIQYLYGLLFDQGNAHSVEIWEGNTLIGGLYGVSIGGAFFGESMFSRRSNASKVALVKLVGRLNAGGYALLDTQFLTDHLARMGATEIPRAAYKAKLAEALKITANFHPPD